MMKLIRTGLMIAVMVILMSPSVFAQGTFYPQGSTIVPIVTYWSTSSNNLKTYIYLSNVTSSSVTCKLTPYGHDGSEIPQYIQVFNGNYNGNSIPISSGTGEFEIPPHSSRLISFVNKRTSQIFGYALIEWASDDPLLRKALIGDVRKIGVALGQGCYPLNGGQMF